MDKKIKNIDRTLMAATLLILGLTLFSLFATMHSAGKRGIVLFSFKSGNIILIDSDEDFKSPHNVTAADNVVISLKRGVYYWKIANTLPEDVVQLILESDVNLKLKESGGGYDVINSEDTELNVDIYKKGSFSGNVVLDASTSGNEVSEVIRIKG